MNLKCVPPIHMTFPGKCVSCQKEFSWTMSKGKLGNLPIDEAPQSSLILKRFSALENI